MEQIHKRREFFFFECGCNRVNQLIWLAYIVFADINVAELVFALGNNYLRVYNATQENDFKFSRNVPEKFEGTKDQLK